MTVAQLAVDDRKRPRRAVQELGCVCARCGRARRSCRRAPARAPRPRGARARRRPRPGASPSRRRPCRRRAHAAVDRRRRSWSSPESISPSTRSTISASHCAPRWACSSADDLLGRARLAVELPRRHHLDRVGDGDDPRAERDRRRRPGGRGSRRRPSARDGGGRSGVRRRAGRAARAACRRSAGASRRSGAPPRRARPGFEQDAVRDADLADVVEDRAEPDRLDLVRRQLEQLRDANGERGEPLAVAVQVRVARLDRVGERARERRCEQPLPQLVAAARRALERVGDGGLQVGVGERLRDEARRAARQRLAQRVVGARARDEHDGQRRAARPHGLEQLQAGEARA